MYPGTKEDREFKKVPIVVSVLMNLEPEQRKKFRRVVSQIIFRNKLLNYSDVHTHTYYYDNILLSQCTLL
jgi:hypothetical protein